MRVLVAMSGGVDSSVAAALLVADGHDVTGATMKLWGGESDSGCCSLADVVDARRVADSLGIEHQMVDMTEDFERSVVNPFVASHVAGQTPNPCVECNRHLKFDHFLDRALRLGYDAIATGHHARVIPGKNGLRSRLLRGHDRVKDQSYVLSILSSSTLARVLLPVGELTKDEVRSHAKRIGLRTADKAESQDLCFVGGASGGREAFLKERIDLHAATVIDANTGNEVGSVDAVELVTVGQRKGIGIAQGTRQYAVSVDVGRKRVVIGNQADLLTNEVRLDRRTWVNEPLPSGTEITVQVSAHGQARHAVVSDDGIAFCNPEQRVAPGQLVALYSGDDVLGSGIAC